MANRQAEIMGGIRKECFPYQLLCEQAAHAQAMISGINDIFLAVIKTPESELVTLLN